MSIKGHRRVVISGSMSFLPDMRALADRLLERGVRAMVPEPDGPEADCLSEVEYLEHKRRLSLQYMKAVKDPRTVSLLVLNPDKRGVHGYIGPNSFAEIAVAFSCNKPVFLFQDAPSIYVDELRAWGAVPLRGDLAPVVSHFNQLELSLASPEMAPLFEPA